MWHRNDLWTLAKRAFGPRREYEVDRARDVLSAAKLTPISETQSTDIFVAGYPKSGNTWFQNLAAGILYGIRPEMAPDELIQDLIPDVRFRPFYRRFSSPMCFKSHELPLPEMRRVVMLVRDGRDVMVSYYHHLQALSNRPVNWRAVIEAGEGLYPCRWHEYVGAWLDNPFRAEILEIRYERLRRDAVQELARFCEFVGLDRSEQILTQIAEGASFENARRKEDRSGWSDPRWPKDRQFVRRGKVGSFMDELPPQMLTAFLNQAAPMLERLGYLDVNRTETKQKPAA